MAEVGAVKAERAGVVHVQELACFGCCPAVCAGPRSGRGDDKQRTLAWHGSILHGGESAARRPGNAPDRRQIRYLVVCLSFG